MEFAIQARLIEHHGDAVVRDETRHNSATALSDAVRTAQEHAADGFTVWIYEVQHDTNMRPTYIGVDKLGPDVRPPRPDASDRRRPRSREPGARQ